MGEKVSGEEKGLVEVEMYRWVLVPPPRAGVLRVYVTLKLTNSLLDFVEVEVLTEKAGVVVKTGFVQTSFDDPGDYVDFVLDMLVQLFNIFEVSEEHYTCDTYL